MISTQELEELWESEVKLLGEDNVEVYKDDKDIGKLQSYVGTTCFCAQHNDTMHGVVCFLVKQNDSFHLLHLDLIKSTIIHINPSQKGVDPFNLTIVKDASMSDYLRGTLKLNFKIIYVRLEKELKPKVEGIVKAYSLIH